MKTPGSLAHLSRLRALTPPLLSSLAGYRLSWIPGDFFAGLAIAAVGIPSAIAYPAIARLPLETGLYASIVPLVAYALFGPSRHLIVGPDAATMTVLAAVLATLPVGDLEGRAATAATLAILVGGFCLGARLMRLGVLGAFLSRPILTGFFAGISVSILAGQIGRVTGVKVVSDGVIASAFEIMRRVAEIHLPTFALATFFFVLLRLMPRLRIPVPGPVIVVLLSGLLSWVFDFAGRGIAVVGVVSGTLPVPHLPSSALQFSDLVIGAAAVFFVSFGAGLVTARSFGMRGGYRVDANEELVGFGAANIASGLFGSFPVTASDSRTAVNLSAGGRSQIVSLVAAGAIAASLVLLQGALALLPLAALGAILVSAAIDLIDLRALAQIWRISRMEFVFAMIALAGPIGLGVLNGVAIAISATLTYILIQNMYPRDAMLGVIAGRDGFYKLHRRPEARPIVGLSLCLIEGSVLFFNADYVADRLRTIASHLPSGTRWLVIDASAVVQVDSTSAAVLEEVRADLAARGIRLGLAEVHIKARRLLERAGLIAAIGPEMIFDDLEDVLRAFWAANEDLRHEAS